MKVQGHFAKFTEAADYCERWARESPYALARAANSIAALGILNGQRFYMPRAAQVIEPFGDIDRSVFDLVKAPYDCIALLSDVQMEQPDGSKLWSWQISIGFSPKSAFNARHTIVSPRLPEICGGSDDDFAILSCALDPNNGVWVTLPCVAYALLSGGKIHMTSVPTSMAEQLPVSQERMCEELYADARSLANLSVMLNLANVKTSLCQASEALQSKRKRASKRPLYSYHVLDVDGVRWQSRDSEAACDGGGVRSHLRRGHIRRVAERHVWVRATYVHGSIPGFVDKDYRVTPAAEVVE